MGPMQWQLASNKRNVWFELHGKRRSIEQLPLYIKYSQRLCVQVSLASHIDVNIEIISPF